MIRTMSMTFRFDRRLCSSGSRRPIAIEAAISSPEKAKWLPLVVFLMFNFNAMY